MEGWVGAGKQTLLTHWESLIFVLAFIFLLGVIVSASRLPRRLKSLVWLALLLRVVGAVARFEVLQVVYGAGDATGYFGSGWRFAQSFRQFDFSPLTQSGDWYGTEFVRSISGIVLAIIGPSMFSEFLVFSFFAFIGLLAFGVAFHRAYPSAPQTGYLLWIWLFPSLWFWPSSVGKEALVLMGIGLSVMGFVGKKNRIRWPLFLLGLLIMFAVRPEIVIVFLVTVVIAQWLAFDGHWTGMKVVQALIIGVVGLVGLWYTMQVVGIAGFDVEGVQEYVENDPARRTTGGTSVGSVDTGLGGVPMAAVNVLFRPFPWEATNPMVLLSSLEVLSLWIIVYLRRRALMRALRHWRSDRTLRLSIVFILVYSVALGVMLVNLGIIARQRIFLFPFLFLMIEADPRSSITISRERTQPGPYRSVQSVRPLV